MQDLRRSEINHGDLAWFGSRVSLMRDKKARDAYKIFFLTFPLISLGLLFLVFIHKFVSIAEIFFVGFSNKYANIF
jgi:hypothetical protein